MFEGEKREISLFFLVEKLTHTNNLEDIGYNIVVLKIRSTL